MTGGNKGGAHVTDITNASRTLLLDIHSGQWDPEICSFFGIPLLALPERVLSSAEPMGVVSVEDDILDGILIAGVTSLSLSLFLMLFVRSPLRVTITSVLEINRVRFLVNCV